MLPIDKIATSGVKDESLRPKSVAPTKEESLELARLPLRVVDKLDPKQRESAIRIIQRLSKDQIQKLIHLFEPRSQPPSLTEAQTELPPLATPGINQDALSQVKDRYTPPQEKPRTTIDLAEGKPLPHEVRKAVELVTSNMVRAAMFPSVEFRGRKYRIAKTTSENGLRFIVKREDDKELELDLIDVQTGNIDVQKATEFFQLQGPVSMAASSNILIGKDS